MNTFTTIACLVAIATYVASVPVDGNDDDGSNGKIILYIYKHVLLIILN